MLVVTKREVAENSEQTQTTRSPIPNSATALNVDQDSASINLPAFSPFIRRPHITFTFIFDESIATGVASFRIVHHSNLF